MNKVLIVEDETIVALEIKKVLEKLDFIVTDMATDYGSALKSVKDNKPDIILMDIDLRDDKDGIDVAKQIQKTSNIPIIYTTAYSDEKTLNRAIETNPVTYLIKPFKRDELKSNILLGIYKSKNAVVPKIDKSLMRLGFDYYFDKEKDKLYYKDMFIKLGLKERQLLRILIRANGAVVTFEDLEYKIWHNHTISASTLRTLIYRLRSKLHYDLIETISNVGCRITINE
ncbi:DNA-binding response regulator [Arcobacter sp. CECT 8983]|uniref:response regulator transcription factor n=1 Tax=Arcobacter sp. CECT 8983 TaxID=2044508 RepID=UPI00100AAAC2|nr:response regulator [Arcobacter sp. CECT 8983]RXJ91847.1 DNA-binding response regulator [Arcobacter sp. CECT 8983]